MAKIDRHTGNLIPFGQTAASADRKVFGGIIESNTLDDNLTPELQEGWQAITSPTLFPKLRDLNAAMFTAQQLIAYVIQRGVPEYHDQQDYFIGSMCSNGGQIYVSQSDDNTNNLLTDPLHWKKLTEIPENKITTFELAINAVSTPNLQYGAITLAKMANGNNNKILGFDGSGVPVEYELPLGVGQTWKTTNYTTNTNHYNTTGRAIYVIIGGALSTSGGVNYSINGKNMFNEAAVGFIVPNGDYFRFPSVFNQIELS